MPPRIYYPTPLPHPSTGIFALRHTPQRTHILTGGADRILRLHTVPPTSSKTQTFQSHTRQILSVCAHPTIPEKLLSAGADRSILLWDATSPAQPTRKLAGPHGHSQRVDTAVFAGVAGDLVISGSYDTSVRVWDLRQPRARPVQTLTEASDAVTSVCVVEDDACLLAAGVDGVLRSYDIRCGKMCADVVGPPIGTMTLTRDSLCVLVARLDGSLCMLERASGDVLCIYSGHVNSQFSVGCAVSCDDALVFAASEQGEVCVWDIVDGDRVLQRCSMPGSAVVAPLDAHPIDDAFACGNHDGALAVWRRQLT